MRKWPKICENVITEGGNEPLEAVTLNCLSMLGWEVGIQASYDERLAAMLFYSDSVYAGYKIALLTTTGSLLAADRLQDRDGRRRVACFSLVLLPF